MLSRYGDSFGICDPYLLKMSHCVVAYCKSTGSGTCISTVLGGRSIIV